MYKFYNSFWEILSIAFRQPVSKLARLPYSLSKLQYICPLFLPCQYNCTSIIVEKIMIVSVCYYPVNIIRDRWPFKKLWLSLQYCVTQSFSKMSHLPCKLSNWYLCPDYCPVSIILHQWSLKKYSYCLCRTCTLSLVALRKRRKRFRKMRRTSKRNSSPSLRAKEKSKSGLVIFYHLIDMLYILISTIMVFS